jgi:hypothetical protein
MKGSSKAAVRIVHMRCQLMHARGFAAPGNADV